MLTERDKQSCAQNILKYARGLAQHCKSPSDALLTIGKLKQGVIKQFGLRDHAHPAHMQLQILSDYIFSRQQSIPDHTYARFALEKLTNPLTAQERTELFELLENFL